jgi:oligoribonuclease (3'-5' exoribonuclease)
MELKEVIKYILNGEAVLFAGAGFSRNATNLENEQMKDATKLSEELCLEMGIDKNNDLGIVSDYYLGDKKDPHYIMRAQNLITKLQNKFTCNEVKEEQKIITLNDWIRIYTTNYDNVIEFAGKDIDKYNRTPVTLHDSTEHIRNLNSVVHLNGYIRNLDVNKLDKEFKLITRSYLVEDFTKSDICGLFNRDLKEARVIIFIGTSLKYDLDIQRIIYSIDENNDKIIFIDKIDTDGKIDVLEDRRKNILGKVFYIGVEGLANEIEKAKITHVHKEDSFIFRSFQKIEQNMYAYNSGNRSDIWNLFSNGKIEREMVYAHTNDDEYIVRRSIIRDIEYNIKSDNMTVNIIHSNLGNGKTCLLEFLMCYLSETNYVYKFNECYSDIEKELKAISKIDGRKVIFIENYNLYIDIIKNFRYYYDNSWNIILSCRTFINNNSIYKLSNALDKKVEDFYEFDINKFTEPEKPKIVSSLRNINQAEFKDLDERRALNLLRKNGQDCWSNTVMYLFKSGVVRKRIEKVFDNILSNPNNTEVVIAAIINNIVGMNLSYSQLLCVIKASQLKVSCFRDDNVAEILTLGDGKIEIKSSLLSLYIIRSRMLHTQVIDVMKKMVLNADLLMDNDAEMVKRLLISTSNISELFYKKIPYFDFENTENELHKEILDYYDSVCKVEYYSKNEFFWLQYAMAAMDLENYSLAENNFKLAHLYESKKNHDSYQIKVQYGRFLLEKAILEEDETAPIQILKRVNQEWRDVLLNNEAQQYYVYKQIEKYKNFVCMYSKCFSNTDFSKAIKYIENLISTISKCNRNGRNKNIGDSALNILTETKDELDANMLKHSLA